MSLKDTFYCPILFHFLAYSTSVTSDTTRPEILILNFLFDTILGVETLPRGFILVTFKLDTQSFTRSVNTFLLP